MIYTLLLFCICLSATLSLENRVIVETFQATDEWQEIKDGQKVPGGLHYRMNLETGKKEAKLLAHEENSKETGAVLVNPDLGKESEAFSAKTVEELSNLSEHIKGLSFNRDTDQLKLLIANYGNSTSKGRLTILDELEYLLHQIDNANDFIVLDGFTQVILPALDSDQPELVEGAAILVGSASQSNSKVQLYARESGLLKLVLDLCDVWSNKSQVVTGRLIFALSSLVRDNEENLQYFHNYQGHSLLLRILQRSENDRVNLKVLMLGADTLPASEVESRWCKELLNDKVFQIDDLDGLEKIVYCFKRFRPVCSRQMVDNIKLKEWLEKGTKLLKEAQDNELDFGQTLFDINQLNQFFVFEKVEL